MKSALFLAILLLPQTTVRPSVLGLTRVDRAPSSRVRVWRPDRCVQLDGRKSFCPTLLTRYFVSHWDHGHVPFHPPARAECLGGTRPPARFAAWRKLPPCPRDPEIELVLAGVDDWDSNRASRVYFFPAARVIALGDLLPRDLARGATAIRARKADWIILPRSGAIGKTEADLLRKLNPRFGFIAATPNARAFDPGGKIFLRLSDWGNLVFAAE